MIGVESAHVHALRFLYPHAETTSGHTHRPQGNYDHATAGQI
jgi:hypothetical protein